MKKKDLEAQIYTYRELLEKVCEAHNLDLEILDAGNYKLVIIDGETFVVADFEE